MKKIVLPFLMALVLAAMMAAPALAQPQAAPIMPAGTASPRDWEKIAPDGELLASAIKADSAILMDANSGKILFEKDANEKRYPASITKIMTCLVALESKKGLDSIVTVGKLPKLPGDATNIKLIEGEQMKLEDMLYGLMLESGNDAANAIAMYLGQDGSIDNFVSQMNEKAKQLGMTGTHWANTNGLHNDDHYTTAHDMALLAAAAMKNPDFVKIVSTAQYTMEPTNKHSDTRIWKNTNKLLSDKNFGYVYAKGIKTGYTNPAEYTLVSSAVNGDKNNMMLVAVVLHESVGDSRWPDSVTMFEYGFKYYETVNIVEDILRNQPYTVTVENAAAGDEGKGSLKLELQPDTDIKYITDKADVIDALKNDPSKYVQVQYSKSTAPIKKDDVVGTVTFQYNDTTLTCNLLASRDVAEMPAATVSPSTTLPATAKATPAAGPTINPANTKGSGVAGTTTGIGPVLIWVGVIILALVVAMLITRIFNTARRNKKYRQYNSRQNGARMRR